MGIIERSYGKVLRTALKTVNPLKKLVIKTECEVHKFINKQAVIILMNDGYNDAFAFFKNHIEDLNIGVVWADQDLKSSNHFYNPKSNSGLYGFSNALKECTAYYTAALTWWERGDIDKAVLYLGASCHLIQDVTVPQHVNIKLLKQHRKYEQWVIRTYMEYDEFKCYDKGIYLDNIKDFILANAFTALNAYEKSRDMPNTESRFFNITDKILCQAQRTTSGMLNMFYNSVQNMGEKVDG